MADYSDIRGYRVKYLSSDPTLSTANEGQVWYNSTEGVLKSLVQIKAWSAGGNLSNSFAGRAGFGTQSATMMVSGYPPSVPPISTATEEYNGYAWTAGGNVNTARAMGLGFGTQTAGTVVGGGTTFSAGFTAFTDATEEYNGTAWTTVNPFGENIWYGGTVGTQTAGLNVAGLFPSSSPTSQNTTKEYDGTNWTAGGNINVAGSARRGTGIQTAALGTTKSPSPTGPTSVTEEYNGSAWTASNPTNSSKGFRGISSAGTQDSVLIFGGEPATTESEFYDGTSWTVSPATTSSTKGSSSQIGGGTGTAAIFPGGELIPPGAGTNIVEEYNSSISTFTKAAWASGGSLPAGRLDGVSGTLQTQNAAYVAGGEGPGVPNGVYNTTFEYNGSTWSPSGNLSTARAQAAGAGTQTAGLASGGVVYDTSPYPAQAAVEDYNGSTWTTGTGLPAARTASTGTGSQTAALVFGGTPGFTTTTISYNGSAWSSENPTNSSKVISAGAGPQTATIASQGGSAATEEYNGTSWTSLSDAPYAASNIGGFGTQTAFVTSGGTVAPVTPSTDGVTFTSYYDGTGWSSSAPMTQARRTGGSPTGSHSAGLATGGYSTPTSYIAVCEEYTGNTATTTASDLTTS
jgi:hypothetical protein